MHPAEAVLAEAVLAEADLAKAGERRGFFVAQKEIDSVGRGGFYFVIWALL